jgi:hypothetical protein
MTLILGIYLSNMRVQFLRDVTVEVMELDTGDNDTFDRLIRSNVAIDVDDIVPLSRNFSNFTVGNQIWINVKNTSFRKVV